MKIATTIADVIRASDARSGVEQEVSPEQLVEVCGGDGVPSHAPEFSQYWEGQTIAAEGSDRFWEGAAMMAGATVLPPPADIAGAIFAGGRMVAGAQEMDRGEAMMDAAQASYEASLATQHPADIVMEPLVVTPNGAGDSY